jgi:long-chain fatty acid transport protein
MRKLLTFFAAALISASVLAGGLVTNTNQSAMFTRLQNRNASTGIDAVYFNPAGLTKLGNGLFVSINNQTISQTKTITTNYPYLSPTPKEYVGNVSAPLFPGAYIAYNTGNLSFSFGFNPVGGGGGAKYKKGLPSFETGVSDLVPLLASQNITTTQYSADIFFEGSSVYFGYQANIGYKISDMLSVAGGVRLVSAKNTYEGYINRISVNPNFTSFGAAFNGSMVLATDFFTAGANTLNALSNGASAFASGLQPIITGGGGSVPLSSGTAVGLTAAQVGQIQQILGAAGLTPAQIGAITIAQSQAVLAVSAPQFATKAGAMSSNAAATTDRSVDAEQTGMGYTPILSANFSPNDQLNISVRYEFKTKLELTTKVKNGLDGGGIFVDGQKIIADMPAELAIGAEYKPNSKFKLAGTFNIYFDQNVDYDGSELVNTDMIDKNFLEYGLGAEFGVTEKLRLSAGWVATRTSVNELYQNDQEYSTNTNSFGAGFGYRISPMIDLNLGGQYTFYADGNKTFNHMLGTVPVSTTETYKKKTWLIGVGLDFYFGK